MCYEWFGSYTLGFHILSFKMGDNASDNDMELDFIHRPSGVRADSSDVNMEEPCENPRPTTPLNCHSLSRVDVDDDEDSNFIRRVNNKSFMNRLKFTSTPLPTPDGGTRSHTLPLFHHSSFRIPANFNRSLNESPRVGADKIPIGYVNPFTPEGKMLSSKSSIASNPSMQSLILGKSVHVDDLDFPKEEDPPRRVKLSEFNVSRFNEEFITLEEIGSGSFGCVFKCVNRINGCVYAVKRTNSTIKTSTQEHFIRKEIYGHGVLDHPNIVRNFSCWKEDGFVYIQNEYCNGGSLEKYVTTDRVTEDFLWNLLLQMASGLSYMHKRGLAHLDVKPENIFLCIEKVSNTSLDSDGGFSDSEKIDEEITFKLGDLGHVCKLDDKDVEEGDCRYVAKELFNDSFTLLDRTDIFALGLTVYEVARGIPLPKRGSHWQELREGKIENLDNYSERFNTILKKMTDPEPEKRPSAVDLVKLVKPIGSSSPQYDVYDSIHKYRLTNTVLSQANDQYLKVLMSSHKHRQSQFIPMSPVKDRVLGLKKKGAAVSKARLVGRKTTKSLSTTTF